MNMKSKNSKQLKKKTCGMINQFNWKSNWKNFKTGTFLKSKNKIRKRFKAKEKM